MCTKCKCSDKIKAIEFEIANVIAERNHGVHKAYECLMSVGKEEGLRKAIHILKSMECTNNHEKV